jgi:N-sulfoglucosamine sulfohydrolase
MRNLTFLLLFFTVPAAFAQRTTQPGVARPGVARPNILLITADDLGVQVGCYGDQTARTPRIDQLARDGIRFTNAYVTQASCSASRSSILTGLYPHQNGQIGLAHLGFSMHDTVKTLPAMLKQAGYRTGIIGKLHVEPEKNFVFDETLLKKAALTREVRGVADSAVAFMQRAGSSPFFLMVNYFDPHVPMIPQVAGLPAQPYRPDQVPALPFQKVDALQERARIADFYSCISRLDTGIGLLMDALQASGQADNTLIIFVGDHGAPFVRGKTSCYEAGLKIPFIVRWPGQSKPGTVDPRLVSTVDIVPTVLELAHQPVASSLAGASLLPVLRGRRPTNWRTHLYGEFFYHGPQFYYPRYSVRDGRYKLIVNTLNEKPNPVLSIDGDPAYRITQQPDFKDPAVKTVFDRYVNPPHYELYDLQKDPQEFTDLSADPAYQTQLTTLKQALQNWMAQTKAEQPLKK